jgi:hypothetical protein
MLEINKESELQKMYFSHFVICMIYVRRDRYNGNIIILTT